MKDKREKFVLLAEKRVVRAIRDIRLIGNLANKNNYSYSEQDALKIIAALEGEVKLMKSRFLSDSARTTPLFKL